jgi:phage shock protein E
VDRKKAKKLLSVTMCSLLLIALLEGCIAGREGSSGNQIIESVSLEEAFALMDDHLGDDDFVIVDLRPAEQYGSGHIQNAINIDYQSDDFVEELGALEREYIYLLYSQTERVSGKVLGKMAALGFKEVYSLRGGMEHWELVGLPQVK